MNALQRILNQPGGRIALAIFLSLLIHAFFLFGPKLINLAPIETPPLPLTATLQPLPAAKPLPKPAERPKPPKRAQKIAPPKPVPMTAAPVATIPVASAPESAPVDTTPAASAVPAVAKADEPADSQPVYPLPKLAQLTFAVLQGKDFKIGEARQTLKVSDDHHYILQVSIGTTGLVSLFKTFDMDQTSQGSITDQGLHPDSFSETRVTSKGKQALTAKFDWANRQLAFSAGNQVALPDKSQDMLSFLYQFSQMPLDQASLPLHVSNGRKLERYEFEVGAVEQIPTRIGKILAVPLRKIRASGEEGLEIWLGMEYRLLPVKIVTIDRNGEISGQMILSEIRVSED